MRQRVTDETAGRNYDERTLRSWREDARSAALAGAVVLVRECAMRQTLMYARRLFGGRSIKQVPLPRWVETVIVNERATLAQHPALCAFTDPRMFAIARDGSGLEGADVPLFRLVQVMLPVLREKDNAENLVLRYFWELAVLEAQLEGRQVLPAHMALLAAATGVESLGNRGLEPARRRWESRIARWRKEKTPAPGVAELRWGAMPVLIGKAVGESVAAKARAAAEADKAAKARAAVEGAAMMGEIAKALGQTRFVSAPRPAVDMDKYLSLTAELATTHGQREDHPRTTPKAPTEEVANHPRTGNFNSAGDISTAPTIDYEQVAQCVVSFISIVMGKPPPPAS